MKLANTVLGFPSTDPFAGLWLFVALVSVAYSGTTTTENYASTVTWDGETEFLAVETSRQAISDLTEYIRNLSVVKQKAPPLTTSESGKLKVVVDVLVMLASVVSVDDAEQTMTSAIHLYCSWQDNAIKWNASDFSGVNMIEMTLDSIWTPHLFIMNSDLHRNIIQHANHLEVHSDGRVEAQIPFTAQTLCSMDLEKFPYDTQRCLLIVYTISRIAAINLTYMLMDESISEIMAHKSDWELIQMSYRGVYFGQDAPSIPSVQIELRRRTTFYTVSLVLPMVLTSFMNTLVFLVPLQSGEKVSVLVSIFVSTSVFVTFFKDVMPRGLDSVPATMKLLIGVIVESLVVLLATLFVMWRFHAEQVNVDADASTVSFQSDDKAISKGDSVDDAKDARPSGNKEDDLLGSNGKGGYTSEVNVDTMTKRAEKGGPEIGGTTSPPGGCSRMTAQRLDRVFFCLATVANTTFLMAVFFE